MRDQLSTYRASYPIQNAKKYRIYFLGLFDILTVDYDLSSQTLGVVSVYRGNYTSNLIALIPK